MAEFYTTAEALAIPGIYATLYEGLKRFILNTEHTELRVEFEAFLTRERNHTRTAKSLPIERPLVVHDQPGYQALQVPILSSTAGFVVPVYENRWLQVADEMFTPVPQAEGATWEEAWAQDIHIAEGELYKAVLWEAAAESTNCHVPQLQEMLFVDHGGKEVALEKWKFNPLQPEEYPGGVQAFKLTHGRREVWFTEESLNPNYRRYSVFTPCRETLVVFLTMWDVSRSKIMNSAVVYQAQRV